ncbi:glycosyl transferase [Klebsiella pneumoniae]|uniref:Glycosyl transferase n=1 Tax=Klebsiella pneumoniae TaxID=573 RepID=A0A377WK01_KLEPN|nr:glycosyl transferase [Klebsiella pneumoniae]
MPYGDEEALAAALVRVISDKALQKEMQAAAIRNARRYYATAIAGRWESWLQHNEQRMKEQEEKPLNVASLKHVSCKNVSAPVKLFYRGGLHPKRRYLAI